MFRKMGPDEPRPSKEEKFDTLFMLGAFFFLIIVLMLGLAQR